MDNFEALVTVRWSTAEKLWIGRVDATGSKSDVCTWQSHGATAYDAICAALKLALKQDLERP